MRLWTACGLLGLLGLGALALPACDDAGAPNAEPLSELVDEPSEALRPVATRGEIPSEARITDYGIDARLDERSHEIHATLRVAWRNRSAQTVDTLPFHLYMNGFRAEDTAWMASARGSHRGQQFSRDRWGFIHVSRVELVAHLPTTEVPSALLELDGRPDSAPPTPPQSPLRPLDYAEDDDPSTMQVALDQPVPPGHAVVLDLEFVTRLPRVFARAGYFDEFHMAGQWFPKLGVLDDPGGWQTHTFSLFSEFYADFGTYDVTLDVPEDYVVGATGIRVESETAEPGRKRLRYHAEMVHDFAWVADPEFVEHWGEYEGIRIRQLIQPAHAADAPIHMQAQLAAFESMEARFGAYPWSTLTIVHPPEGAKGAAGMEYPTLYTSSDISISSAVPEFLIRERVTGVMTSVHEFGHQYFQGLFASNEFAQPWLDEGLNTAANHLVYWDAYGEDPWVIDLLGNPLSSKDLVALSLLFNGDVDPIDQPADAWDPIGGAYGTATYQKTAALLLTLREVGGHERFDRAMAEYAAQARFRHPTGRDFEAILSAEMGGAQGRVLLSGEGGPGSVWLDVGEVLDQGLHEVGVVDFRLTEVGNRRRLGHSGWHPGVSDKREVSPAVAEAHWILTGLFGRAPVDGPAGWTLTPSPESWDSPTADIDVDEVEGYVVIQRRTSFRIPVDLRVEFADAEPETLIWDGQAPHQRFDFPGRRVVRAVLDPDRKLVLEPNRFDNARFASTDEDPPDDPLAEWIGDIAEASELAALGGLGL